MLFKMAVRVMLLKNYARVNNVLRHFGNSTKNMQVKSAFKSEENGSKDQEDLKSEGTKSGLSSALFVPGNKANQTFAILSPYLDFTQRFSNMAELKANLHMRGMERDVDSLSAMWKELKSLEVEKDELDAEKIKIANVMKSLAKDKKKNKSEMEELKVRGKEVREKAKELSQRVWDLEENAVIGALKLPNSLHKSTQASDRKVLQLFDKPDVSIKTRSHIEIGKTNGLLEFTNASPSAYYLKKELALLEIVLSQYFLSMFESHGYTPHSNPDFSKAVVVEGSSVDVNKNFLALSSHINDADSNLTYLVGGASLQSMVAYFTKQIIENQSSLPQKIVSIGRNYKPAINEDLGLFECTQSTSVNALLLFENQVDEELIMNEALMALVQCYAKLKLHFRLTQYSARKLEPQEKAAIGLEMFSPHTKSYHEVARISLCGDFISKRLWVMCRKRDQFHTPSSTSSTSSTATFLSMIHIKVCRLAPLLGAVLEAGQSEDGHFVCPDQLSALMTDWLT